MNRTATRQANPRQWTVALFVLVAGALFSLGASLAHAAPPAGTVIGNQATATYNDAGGTARVTTSNQVQTTVTQVKTFTLTANGARTAAPGQTVYYPHTITNTGNGTDTYTLNPPTSNNFAAAAAPHGSLAYYIDANGDGVPDNAAPINTSGALAAGGVFRFVVAGTVPAAAANGNTADIVVSVSDTVVTTATNTDTTTVASSVITVTKALSPISGPSPNTGVPATVGAVTVTLSYSNSGSSAATSVELRDAIPAGMTYVAGTGRWSVSGATALADGAGGDPAGISYDYNITALGRVTAIIASVPAGGSGTLTFQVNVNNGVVPGFINNTAQYLTSTQPITNTNTASYQVLQSGGVVANGSVTSSVNGTSEPVVVAAAAAGSTVNFTNVIWNLGNAAETFVISMAGQGAWPAGSAFTLLQSDGATTLIANTTPPIPLFSAGCAAGFEADAVNQRCGYRVILRVQLPASAAGGPYSITKTATSSFDNTKSDTVIDTLTAVTANTVDVTNNTARLDSNPPGTAAAGNAATTGFGATGANVITTNNVTPSTSVPTVTRFQLYVNNTGALNDSFNLSIAAIPAGWTAVFRADGGAGNCTTVGAATTTTGILAAGANRLICAEVTVPATISAQAAPGTYNFDFTATSATNAAVNEVKRDAVVIAAVHSVSLTPNNAQQTLPGGSLTYSHALLNSGNVSETISFAPGFLTDTRAPQGWTSAAYVDGNGNGVFDPGVDDVPANLISAATTFPLAVNASRAIFVRVTAPATATAADPANVTTLIAGFNAGATSVSATDTTTVANGLTLQKMQRTVNCDGTAPGVYSAAPLAAGPLTLAGRCLQYQVTGQNTSAANMTLVAISDNIPANTKQINTCGAPATSVGAIASPGPGNTGTINATVGTLTPSQSVIVTFCVQIDP
ncbi:MAG: beta strand repeat-containing protein [Usitatibacter sp.]